MRVRACRPPISRALLLPFLASCGESSEARMEAVVRDSAGIRIVENAAPTMAPTFTTGETTASIGVAAGAEEYELHDVASVVPLSDGTIAVATAGSEIRWYDPRGRFLRRAGGEGDGPGEFRRIRYMRALADDSLLVFDARNRRLSVLGPEGGFARSRTIGADAEQPIGVAGALRDGTILTRATVDTPPASTPLYRVRMAFAVSRGNASLPLPPYLGPEAALHVEGSGGGIGSVFISVLPFARSAHASAGPDHFFIGSSDAYRIDVWDGAGRLVRSIRVALPAVPVSDEVREAYIASEMDRRRLLADARGRPFEEAAVRRQLLEQPHAPMLPAYEALLATGDGGLWVKEFAVPGARRPSERWTRFDRHGRLTGIIDFAPGFTPMHVRGDTVLGVFRDTLDVPYVHGYAVRRQTPETATGINTAKQTAITMRPRTK